MKSKWRGNVIIYIDPGHCNF